MSGVLDIDLGWKYLLKELRGLSKKEIKAGIQGGKTKDGTADLVTVAAVQEFGAMIFQHPGEVTVYRKVKKDGSFANNGRFAKKSKANFSSTHRSMGRLIIIPERSFIRATFDEKSDEIGERAESAVTAIINGADVSKALARTGQYIEGEIKRKIGSGPFTPNSPATIRKKKSSKPLIDTGHMRQSVRYEIGDRSDE